MAISMDRKELVLYSISIMNDSENKGEYYDNHLASALDITTNSLNRYMKQLDDEGFLNRRRSKYHRTLDDTVSITPLGLNELEQLNETLKKMTLTPERHNVPSCIPIHHLLKRTKDPMERIFLLSLITRTKSFDLMMFLSALRIAKNNNSLINIFSDMKSGEKGNEKGNYNIAEGIFKTYLYTEFNEDRLLSSQNADSDIDSLLILGNAYQRQGRNNDAKMIFDLILSEKMHPNQNQWFIANYGIARILRSKGKPEDSIDHLYTIMEMTDNRIFHALCKERIAMTLSEMGKNDRASVIYKSVLNSFGSFGMPVLSAMALNNRGILHNRNDRLDLAEDDWTRAMRYAKQAKNEMAMACVQLNLSNVDLRKGKVSESKLKMDFSNRIFSKRQDLEGIACVEFNLALLYCCKKEWEKVIEHFKRSEEVAFPAPSPLEKEERRRLVMEMAEKNGLKDLVLPPPPYVDCGPESDSND